MQNFNMYKTAICPYEIWHVVLHSACYAAQKTTQKQSNCDLWKSHWQNLCLTCRDRAMSTAVMLVAPATRYPPAVQQSMCDNTVCWLTPVTSAGKSVYQPVNM